MALLLILKANKEANNAQILQVKISVNDFNNFAKKFPYKNFCKSAKFPLCQKDEKMRGVVMSSSGWPTFAKFSETHHWQS